MRHRLQSIIRSHPSLFQNRKCLSTIPLSTEMIKRHGTLSNSCKAILPCGNGKYSDATADRVRDIWKEKKIASGRHSGEVTIYPDERIEDKVNGPTRHFLHDSIYFVNDLFTPIRKREKPQNAQQGNHLCKSLIIIVRILLAIEGNILKNNAAYLRNLVRSHAFRQF